MWPNSIRLLTAGANPAELLNVGYSEYQEAYNFAQQTGAFEVRHSDNVTHGKVLRQVVLREPIHWCPIILSQPVGVIGNYQWSAACICSLNNLSIY